MFTTLDNKGSYLLQLDNVLVFKTGFHFIWTFEISNHISHLPKKRDRPGQLLGLTFDITDLVYRCLCRLSRQQSRVIG